MTTDDAPQWRRHLTPEEEAEVASLDRAIAMHRELMAPLIEARRRAAKMATMRMWRQAGAQQSDAA